MRVALLIGTLAELDSCHALYANSLVAGGHEVWIGSVNRLSGAGEEVLVVAGRVDGPLKAYEPYPGVPERRGFEDVDVVWVLNYPQPSVETEAWQLLWRLNQHVRFVNDVTGTLMLGSKTNLSAVVPPEHLPRTLVSNSFDELWTAYQSDPEATWLAKPPDADAGADVYLLEPGSSNNRVLLQSMTGNAAVTQLLTKGGLMGFRDRYCLLQEYVPHREEKRVILAAGKPVAQQAHRLAPDEHRGNTAHRAHCSDTSLSTDERRLCEHIGKQLLRHGIRFSGIDLAYPYVFEFNVVNPGGLDERLALGLPDRSPDIIEDLLRSVEGPR
ncbi:hypothetical protein GKQ77_05260 [Streptomyces sp. BG9H]|uniref:Prokaryotic glutathione synthetase ATP-binding domain-containing protein n=1 Tax=Streptomyces anatolicus TaxID=2675858 RepID=A0ABS6YHU5_9ACTN|nr:hypothetical protein [Streptomyces anatolicus]MBW5420979.1 hypothetical protein [Streptomyces anatolicus]